MLVVTTENVPGYRVREVRGQVFGVVVRSRGLGGNIIAGLRSLVGGEIKEYTELLELTRRQAIDRMVTNATTMGANAVVTSAMVKYPRAFMSTPHATLQIHIFILTAQRRDLKSDCHACARCLRSGDETPPLWFAEARKAGTLGQ